MSEIVYNECIEVQGIQVPFVKEIITRPIEQQMRLGKYEGGECSAARKWIHSEDRVLELGAGVGLVSAAVSRIPGVERIVSIEANPVLIEMINETHRINGIDKVELRNGIASTKSEKNIPFYVRGHFWASSMEPDSRPYNEVVKMKGFALSDLINEIDPTVIIADIEGGELEIFDGVDLSGVRTAIIELHPLVYGEEGQQKILSFFDKQGFFAEQEYLSGSVWVLTKKPMRPAPRFFTRGPSDPHHTKKKPKVVIPTCMKDEAPFILEWIAYHRSIGVTDFVVFTNDCSDGTDEMLDRLQDMGIVTHLPNPALAAESTYFQPMAMKYAMLLPEVRDADYVIQTDVDEFINIKTGKGHLKDLLKAVGPFHALSIAEVNFSSNGHWELEDGWVTELFKEHETLTPGHWQARRGVKSIIHGIDNFSIWPVHRPGIFNGTLDKLTWLDGSGNPVPEDFVINHENGIDRRGRYDLVQLDHHPLRSVESYLLKMIRGDVVRSQHNVDTHYYRKRSIGGVHDDAIANKLPAARKEWDILMADKKLNKLHNASVKHHQEKLRLFENDPSIVDIRNWISEHYFPDRKS